MGEKTSAYTINLNNVKNFNCCTRKEELSVTAQSGYYMKKFNNWMAIEIQHLQFIILKICYPPCLMNV